MKWTFLKLDPIKVNFRHQGLKHFYWKFSIQNPGKNILIKKALQKNTRRYIGQENPEPYCKYYLMLFRSFINFSEI